MKRRPSICSLNNGVGDLHPDSDFVLSLFWNPRPGGRQQVREETFGGHLLCARFRVSCPGYEDEPAALLAEQLGSPSHTHTWATLETATAVGGSTQPVDTGEQGRSVLPGCPRSFLEQGTHPELINEDEGPGGERVGRDGEKTPWAERSAYSDSLA